MSLRQTQIEVDIEIMQFWLLAPVTQGQGQGYRAGIEQLCMGTARVQNPSPHSYAWFCTGTELCNMNLNNKII